MRPRNLTKIFKFNISRIALLALGVFMYFQSAVVHAGTVTDKKICQDLKKNVIVTDLNTIVNFLSAGVGIIVVTVIIIGGIQYSMAGDNPQAVAAARQRILNGLIALMAFLFMFAFLQWLIPGGVFNQTSC
jgi:hypothetical protein